jgi:ABC-type branched-subunit amino acid transport system ATPase component
MRAEQGVAILLAEQNAGVLDILDTLIVMQDGALGPARAAQQADKHDVADFMFGTETVQ